MTNDENNKEGVHLVYYTDGSTASSNPGYAGAAAVGYSFKYTERHKNIKHPVHTNLYFTSKGILPDKEDTPIEVLTIVEVIEAINNPTSTNNEAELLGFLIALEKASAVTNLSSLTIYTDSNYIVTSFNENIEKWKENSWRRQDNKPIVHIVEWSKIDEFKKLFNSKNIPVNVIWVKGHSDNYCNNLADLYSAVASNSSRRQLRDNIDNFKARLLDSELTYSDYKKSYKNKDIVMYFRDLYFSSNHMDDTNYCFLSTSDNPNTIGKRDTASIFVTNTGYVPSIINNLKKIYRSIERENISTCCIKLNKLENKDIYRLTELVDAEDLIVKTTFNGKISYSIIRDNTPFIFENGMDYPFIMNATSLFTRMYDLITDTEPNENRFSIDITERIVKEGKIAFSNKEKNLDFTDLFKDKILLKQKLLVTVGYDIPNYLALKNIEKDIQKVYLILNCNRDSNYCTLYVNIETVDRNLYSVNIENKFLCLLRS